ncbi:restriction endonuclease [Candidatus Magnetoovum chiemensis]|nr:restriction endonuclease [Candidatus Magnetoovum chiemensis]
MSNIMQPPVEQAENKNTAATMIELNNNIEEITLTLTPDFDLTEIINGEEVMSPSPFRKHQDIVFRMTLKLGNYITSKKLGKLLTSPLDVILKEGSQRLQPDLLFIRRENLHIAQDWIRGVPDMVCEIVSEGSVVKDTVTKKDIYEYYKVPEYWIVIPQAQSVEILTLENDKYRIYSSAAEGGGGGEEESIVRSKVIEGLEINIKELFEED